MKKKNRQLPTRKQPPATRKSWMTVGVKLLIGVALASNCCIGALLFINHQAARNLERMTAEVLTIRERVDVNLRDTIVKLQQEFMGLPQLFVVDPKQAIFSQVERDFAIRDRQKFEGRESYAALFSRTEKRDLANGQMVAKVDNGNLILAYGLVDAQGAFNSSVEQLLLTSEQPEADLERLRALIASAQSNSNSGAVLEQRVAALGALVADKSIEAEKTRIEILGHVDEITAKEQQMTQANQQQRRFSFTAGLAAILGNVLVLFVLTRIIVERPLLRLTGIVEQLGRGESPEIPWRNRRDQIGVLSSAIGRFREVLLTLKREEERKAADRQRIESLVSEMTASIHHLDDRAGRMAQMSLSLQKLAGITERESKNVAELAGDTAGRTDEVSASSQQISTMVAEIHRELGAQTGEVRHIGEEIERARQQMEELKHSVAEIDTIVGTVDAITDQTKILAINAAIEAMKAGEHGRGFAVVADEVKKLSQNTAHATRDVFAKIEAINATCQAFIASFDALDRGAEQLHRVTATIGQAVDHQRDLTGAIVALTAATGENTQQVSTRIQEVNQAADGVLRLSVDAHRCADEIASLLGDLRSGTVRGLEDMSGGSGEDCTASLQASPSGEAAPLAPDAPQDPMPTSSPVPGPQAPGLTPLPLPGLAVQS